MWIVHAGDHAPSGRRHPELPSAPLKPRLKTARNERGSMSKHLLLGQATPNWRLWVNEPVDQFEMRWNAAYEAHEQLNVQVVLGDQLEAHTLHVNPRAVPWWAIVEMLDANPADSRIWLRSSVSMATVSVLVEVPAMPRASICA
jgi:hypothetical protein